MLIERPLLGFLAGRRRNPELSSKRCGPNVCCQQSGHFQNLLIRGVSTKKSFVFPRFYALFDIDRG
jgi:hypothetical protein